MNRRQFITTTGLTTLATQLPLFKVRGEISPQIIMKPPRLRVGDTVGLVAPAGIIEQKDIEDATKTFTDLGLKVKLGKHILERYGYLAGTDIQRANDINTMFADKSVKAIIAMRGGWGCNRILSLLNYIDIRKHPKIILGYSDITSLLLAINARSRIVTFHGAVATSTWNEFTLSYLQPILFDGASMTMQNPKTESVRVEVINPGKAKGKLVGGNLSVLCSMLGSPYLPSWNRRILFAEDIGEDVYRIDRMLAQLKNAGILNQISGFIFGQCTNCKPGDEPTFNLNQVLKDQFQSFNIPVFYGSMIGHIKDKFTIPLGVEVEMDAVAGTIKMLESAVS
ncbi:S66 peptidase family protein [Brunnivagina elsteri]|uniref:LD-carboxypeptidase n=1 Tax=Brunnivagina elsteri CCALA 953 TaxID=987040 RepID=A0A2A2TLU0_9CYAN|nr:LD-carboxypeptidase [Calothrix elsteri]PAX58467.1 LD-carboxypeptidase [Calothrix elsteri CCALA 953]